MPNIKYVILNLSEIKTIAIHYTILVTFFSWCLLISIHISVEL